jgi:hypothetical protein
MMTEDEKTAEFLRRMTELSHDLGIGIVGSFDLFTTEPDDAERRYIQDRGRFEFV